MIGLLACSECGAPVRLVHRFPDGIEPGGYVSHSAQLAEHEGLQAQIQRLDRMAKWKAVLIEVAARSSDKDLREAARAALSIDDWQPRAIEVERERQR